MGTEQLEARLGEARQKLRELQEELEGLERAYADIGRDAGAFADQLARKRTLAQRAANLGRSSAALGFGTMMGERLGSSFQASVGSCFDGMKAQVKQAADQVCAEMDDERRRIALLQEDLSAERERMRIEAERAQEGQRNAAEGERS